jgi:hypothetical protein
MTRAVCYEPDRRLSHRRQVALHEAFVAINTAAWDFAQRRCPTSARHAASASRALIEEFGVRRARRLEIPS